MYLSSPWSNPNRKHSISIAHSRTQVTFASSQSTNQLLPEDVFRQELRRSGKGGRWCRLAEGIRCSRISQGHRLGNGESLSKLVVLALCNGEVRIVPSRAQPCRVLCRAPSGHKPPLAFA